MSEQLDSQMAAPSGRTPVIRRPWVLWFLFFFQFAAIGAYFVYLNVWLHQAGLSGTEIGVINMITALVGVVSVSLWGYLSDLTGKNRLLIAVGAVGALLAAQFIPLVHTFAGFLVLGCIGSAMGSGPGTLVDSATLACWATAAKIMAVIAWAGPSAISSPRSRLASFTKGPACRSCFRPTAP